MSSYKLYYFDLRGRAEVARLIFAAAGEKYEDIRYSREEWPQHKAEAPLGQIPILEVDGVKLPQSLSIARYLAKQFQLAGRDNLEQAKVDAVVDTVTDFVQKYIPVHLTKDETKKQEVLREEAPKHFKNLETLQKIYEGNNFFVGNHLTWADLWFYDITETVLNTDSTILDKYPNLQKIRQQVEQDAKVAAYLKSRPKLPF
ncbi:unnamed protein product [Didymodactylos carnosus]|uniref:glutathione transferase n=1 Tax=Didymodactylos carnosus TaxID=1234261 RepID=A0A815AAT8_9BILA|nr:unnamed protein product [Didymodactylos carnosus]CAF1254925.1 unnamed protein product [Didymodactylos carnosus]CAF4004578.1 unnamed protein product [Didymodactylos carnosus]CAF4026670.1 unnamed protein product [Didymodactylos carnosus]